MTDIFGRDIERSKLKKIRLVSQSSCPSKIDEIFEKATADGYLDGYDEDSLIDDIAYFLYAETIDDNYIIIDYFNVEHDVDDIAFGVDNFISKYSFEESRSKIDVEIESKLRSLLDRNSELIKENEELRKITETQNKLIEESLKEKEIVEEEIVEKEIVEEPIYSQEVIDMDSICDKLLLRKPCKFEF